MLTLLKVVIHATVSEIATAQVTTIKTVKTVKTVKYCRL
jgi:hypothetical protein